MRRMLLEAMGWPCLAVMRRPCLAVMRRPCLAIARRPHRAFETAARCRCALVVLAMTCLFLVAPGPFAVSASAQSIGGSASNPQNTAPVGSMRPPLAATALGGYLPATPPFDESGPSPWSLNMDLDFPVVVAADDFSDVTAGAAWELHVSRLAAMFGRRSLSSGILAGDGSFFFQSAGSWLMNSDLNRDPLTARLHFDAGFELIPHPPDDIPTDIFIDDSPQERWRLGDLRYQYRAAFTLEAGAEADQEFDVAFVSAGGGLRLLNLSRTGWSGWMPSLLIMYDHLIRITDADEIDVAGGGRAGRLSVEDLELITSASQPIAGNATADNFGRMRIVYRHQLDLGTIGLSGFALAGGFQYTRDFGQSGEFRDAGLHSRFGWVADLSRAIRWGGRERPGRIDLFVRHSGGRIAPLVDSDRSLTVGLRLPYSR